LIFVHAKTKNGIYDFQDKAHPVLPCQLPDKAVVFKIFAFPSTVNGPAAGEIGEKSRDGMPHIIILVFNEGISVAHTRAETCRSAESSGR
jgi:hypothetical protein